LVRHFYNLSNPKKLNPTTRKPNNKKTQQQEYYQCDIFDSVRTALSATNDAIPEIEGMEQEGIQLESIDDLLFKISFIVWDLRANSIFNEAEMIKIVDKMSEVTIVITNYLKQKTEAYLVSNGTRNNNL
jgi:hypothetical protein